MLFAALWVPKLFAQTIPVAYWKFDIAATPWLDTEGGDNNLWTQTCDNGASVNCGMLPTALGGPGGRHLVQTKDDFFKTRLTPNGSNSCPLTGPQIGNNSQVGMTTAAEDQLTVEFLYQSGCNFARSTFIEWTNRINFQIIQNEIRIMIWTANQAYTFTVLLNGMERRNIGYYSDMEWHHIVLTFDRAGAGSEGELKLYVDGLCHPEFIFHTDDTDALATLGTNDMLYIPASGRGCAGDPPSRRFDGQLDEYAIYDETLSDEVVLEHYLNFFPNAYSACLTGPALGPLNAYNNQGTTITPAIVACALATLPADLRPQTSITYPSNTTVTGEFTYVPEEFAPNYPDVTQMDHPLKQLQEYPTPRYEPGHKLNPNHIFSDVNAGINLVWRPNDPNVLGSAPGADANYMIDVGDELIQHYNYGLFMGTLDQSLADEARDPTNYEYMAAEYAVAHPAVQRFLNANWGPESDYQHFVQSGLSYTDYMDQNLVANADRSKVSQRNIQPLASHYLFDPIQNFPISVFDCDTTHGEDFRMWDPTESAVPGLMEADGVSQGGWLDEYLKLIDPNPLTSLRTTPSALNNSIDFMLVNQEQLLWNGCTYTQNDVSFNAQASTCCGSFYEGGGNLFTNNIMNPYRDGLLNYAPLANDLGANFRFTFYDISGRPTYVGPINQTQGAHAQNGFATDNFLTPNYYPQRQFYWYQSNVGGFTSWTTLVAGRQQELSAGLDVFTCNVTPGANSNDPFLVADFDMLRPATYLGMLKSISMLGAEDFMPFVYNIDGEGGNEHYGEWNIYQMAIPSYAQAVTSRYEDFLDDGELLPGDFHQMATAAAPAYSFSTGNVNDLVVVREDISGSVSNERYAILGTTQRAAYFDPDATPVEKDVKIDLEGTAGPVVELHFTISRQGNTYIYDRDPATFAAVGTTKPSVFYQLDGWHDWTHPSRWSHDFAFEAEVHDGNTSAQGVSGLQAYEPWTEVPNPAQITANIEDYTDYTTYMTWWNSVTECFQQLPSRPELLYRFTPRVSSQQTLKFYVRARAKGGVATGLDVELPSLGSQPLHSATIACITDPSWQWYNVDINSVSVEFSNLALTEQILSLFPLNSALEIDQILLTAVGSAAAPTLAAASACIAPVSSFTFGQSQCLTNSGIQFTNTSTQTTSCATYVWDFGDNNGSVLENPVHNYGASGSYTVTLTVTDLAGITSQSSQTLVVSYAPSVTVTPDPIDICNDECIDVEVSVSGGAAPYTYSWIHHYTIGSNPTPYSQNVGTTDLICFRGDNALTNQSLEVTVTDANGCTATYTITSITISSRIEQCSGVIPNGCCELDPGEGKSGDYDPFTFSGSQMVRIYPNPVNDRLHVLLNPSVSQKGLEIEIRDMQGRTLRSWVMDALPEPFEVPVSDLKSGSYVISISNDEGTVSTETFLKQ